MRVAPAAVTIFGTATPAPSQAPEPPGVKTGFPGSFVHTRPSGEVAYPIWIARGPFPAYHIRYTFPSWTTTGLPSVWSQPAAFAMRTGLPANRVQLMPSELVAYPRLHWVPTHPWYHIL